MTPSSTTVLANEPMQQLLLMIVQTLVDDSDAVEVNCIEDQGATTLDLRVAWADTGKVIGKQGRTARSIRTILSAAGMKSHRHYSLNSQQERNDSHISSAAPNHLPMLSETVESSRGPYGGMQRTSWESGEFPHTL